MCKQLLVQYARDGTMKRPVFTQNTHKLHTYARTYIYTQMRSYKMTLTYTRIHAHHISVHPPCSQRTRSLSVDGWEKEEGAKGGALKWLRTSLCWNL